MANKEVALGDVVIRMCGPSGGEIKNQNTILAFFWFGFPGATLSKTIP